MVVFVVAGTEGDDGFAVGGEDGVAVEVGMIGEARGLARAVGVDAPDVAAVDGGPGDVDDGAAVGRPGGIELGLGGGGEAVRRAVG